jgi:hypothetical protein
MLSRRVLAAGGDASVVRLCRALSLWICLQSRRADQNPRRRIDHRSGHLTGGHFHAPPTGRRSACFQARISATVFGYSAAIVVPKIASPHTAGSNLPPPETAA